MKEEAYRSVMTEIDPARKRGGGGEEAAATGRRNKQIIGCQSGVAMPFGGEIWWGLVVYRTDEGKHRAWILDLEFYLQQRRRACNFFM